MKTPSPVLLLSAMVVLSAPAAPGLADDDAWEDTDEDRNAGVSRAIEELMGFYVVKPDRRDPLETVVVDGTAAEIWYLHSMKRGHEKRSRCNAYRWLLFGRLHRARGVKAVFDKFDFLEEVKLVFFEVKTRIEPDGRRGYRQFRKTSPRMEVTITRETASALNYDVLRSRVAGPRCVAEAEKVVDRHWYRE